MQFHSFRPFELFVLDTGSIPGEQLESWVDGLIGRALPTASLLHEAVLSAGAIVTGLLLGWIARVTLAKFVFPLVQRSRTDFDDALLRNRFFMKLSILVPVYFLYRMAPAIFHRNPGTETLISKLLMAGMIAVFFMAFMAFMRAMRQHMSGMDRYKDKPIASYTQLAKIIGGIITTVAVIGLLFERDPIYIFSAMGAASAVLLLVFKDSILGFMASVQLSVNDMVRVGDWVQLEKYGADGEVADITLTTVKVSNWDKTFTTVPTYAFISDAVKNWRGMQESDGRRIKRAMFIKIGSIRFCSAEDLERFAQPMIVKEYVHRTQSELQHSNTEVDTSVPINARRQTNVGIFRAYAQEYLRNEPRVNTDMTLMVRQLDPTRNGLPLEVYCFSRIKDWVPYEQLASDIFDHLLAAAPSFDLEIAEDPTGTDMAIGFSMQKERTGPSTKDGRS